MALSDNMLGAVYMSAAMAGLILNDAIMKYAASDMGVFQAMFLRGIFATAFIGLLAWSRGAFRHLPNWHDQRLILLRGLCELAATVVFLRALFGMPIANITAIMQTLPLAVTLAAALFLKEPFGALRGAAIVIGLLGVLLIVRPGGEGFNIYSILALICVVIVTFREIVTRRISVAANSLYIATVTALIITVSGGVGAVVIGEWQDVGTDKIGWLALAALFLLCGYYFSVAAMRVGEIAIVAPFRYTMMLWAIVLGYFVFGDVPDGLTLIGIVIVVATGVFTVVRERQVKSR